MMFRNAVRVTLFLAAATVLAQSSQPGIAPAVKQQSQTEPKGPAGETPTDPLGVGAIREQVKDMESTLSGMHTVLKQMRTAAGENKNSDSISKANLDMWELMVGCLDQQLQELRSTLAAREDMERRRAALYKQADAKIAASAQAARAAQAARFADAQKNATATVTPTADPNQRPTPQVGAATTAAPTAPSSAKSSTNTPASPN